MSPIYNPGRSTKRRAAPGLQQDRLFSAPPGLLSVALWVASSTSSLHGGGDKDLPPATRGWGPEAPDLSPARQQNPAPRWGCSAWPKGPSTIHSLTPKRTLCQVLTQAQDTVVTQGSSPRPGSSRSEEGHAADKPARPIQPAVEGINGGGSCHGQKRQGQGPSVPAGTPWREEAAGRARLSDSAPTARLLGLKTWGGGDQRRLHGGGGFARGVESPRGAEPACCLAAAS